MASEDKKLVCRDCGQEFNFTVGEQEFYVSHGLQNEPARCPECRTARRKERRGGQAKQAYETVCADCGAATTVPFMPREGRPVYCRECYAKHATPKS